jgi:diaminopimelate epimerase
VQGIEFYRVSGSGNDFLALPEPAADPSPEAIRAWCRRGVSVGADGLFTLRRRGGGAVAMDYRNADGGPAALCLNGTRCAARLAFDLGWAADRVVVETGAGALAARRLGAAAVAVAAPPPAAPPEPCTLDAEGAAWSGWRVTVGVPHLVLFWPDSLAAAPVAALGRALRRHPALAPEGANVDFVRFPAPGRMEIRSYERGVEAETLACGSGVVASAVTATTAGKTVSPVECATKSGVVFRVEILDAPGGQRAARLTGDAREIYAADLTEEAWQE